MILDSVFDVYFTCEGSLSLIDYRNLRVYKNKNKKKRYFSCCFVSQVCIISSVSKMPTAEHEHYTNSMEKLTRDMCSTPLPAKYENDNQLRTPTSCSETKYYTFDDLYFEIKLELEKLRRIKTKRYKWLQNLINIYKNDRKFNIFVYVKFLKI